MAVKLADAVARLGVDDSELNKGLGSAEKRVGTMGSVFTGAMMGVGLAIAQGVGNTLRGAVDGLTESIGLASDLSETVSKTGQLFGDNTTAILDWSKTASSAFGQTQQQALDAAANFAMFGQAAGLSGQDLVGFSEDFTVLASDLASFNNTSPQQAIDAIGAALRGEAEPLRAYNVLLDDATLKAAAFELGLTSSNTEALTQQQKILAAQKVIFDQTKVQQGDYERTAGGLANMTRQLGSQWTELKTSLGSVFLPFLETVAGGVGDLTTKYLPQVTEFLEGPMTEAFTGWGQGLADMGGKLQTWYGNYGAPFLADWLELWKGMEIGPQVQEILATLDQLSAWFAPGGGGGALSFWAVRSAAAISALVETMLAEFQSVLGVLTLTTQAVDALQSGNIMQAIQYGQAAAALGSVVNPNGFGGLFSRYYGSALADMQASMEDNHGSGYTYPYNVTPQAGNNVYLPAIQVTINTSADPAAVASAAQSGLQQALRGAGLQ